MSTFTLADSFDATDRLAVDMAAPLPLGCTEAIRRALGLRAAGHQFSYSVIAVVMAEYHGFKRSSSWWRQELRAGGTAPRYLGASFRSEVSA